VKAVQWKQSFDVGYASCLVMTDNLELKVIAKEARLKQSFSLRNFTIVYLLFKIKSNSLRSEFIVNLNLFQVLIVINS